MKPEQVAAMRAEGPSGAVDKLRLPAVDRIYTVGEGKGVIVVPAASQRAPKRQRRFAAFRCNMLRPHALQSQRTPAD